MGLKKYRVYVTRMIREYGSVEVEAESKDEAMDIAYDAIAENFDAVDDIEYGDDDGWEIENGEEDVEELDNRGYRMNAGGQVRYKNPVTGYSQPEILLRS